MKSLAFLTFFSLSLLLAQQSAWAQATLREQLETALLKTRTAVIEQDLQAFLSSIDPINPRSNVTAEQWQQFVGNKRLLKLLLRATPDPDNELYFLTIKTDGDWAAYYAETELADDNYQTLKVFLFHHSDAGWRPAGKSHGLTKAKPGGQAAEKGFPAWTGQQEMFETIESDKDFSLEQLSLPESQKTPTNNPSQ